MTSTLTRPTNVFLDGLNPQQLQAAQILEGPVCVIAIPGSGKSTTMTRRLGHLLINKGVDPSETLTMTFTRKAAEEMKAKVTHNIQEHVAQLEHNTSFAQLEPDKAHSIARHVHHEYIRELTIGTFHSVCSRLLRKNISLYQEGASKWTSGFSFLERPVLMKKVKDIAYNQMNVSAEKFPPGTIIDGISRFKMKCLSPDDVSPQTRVQELHLEIYKELRKFQVEENLIDFDDMIMMTARLFNQNSDLRRKYHNTYRHISIDEFQDTDNAQYQIVKSLACNGLTGQQFKDWTNRSLFIVGDLDQAIYSWRGAEMEIMMSFEEDFSNDTEKHDVKMLKIEHNYRSTSTITGAANEMIKNNMVRIDKDIIASRDKGSLIQVIQKENNIEEAKFIAAEIKRLMEKNPDSKYQDYAILVRQNAFTLQVEKALTAQALPYVIGGGRRFNERREIKILLSYMQMLVNPDDNSSFNYIVNVPKRGIGATTLKKIYDHCRENEISIWQFLSQEGDIKPVVGRSTKNVLEFVQFMRELMEETKDMDVVEMLQAIIAKSKICAYLTSDAESSETADERLENIDALVSVAYEFVRRTPEGQTQEFIDQMVFDGIDTKDQEHTDAVKVMTVHASKGLEFPVVFVAGMENGSFPAKMDMMAADSMEESRRLFYVAITRAKDHLYLTQARNRWVRKTVVDGRGKRQVYEEMERRNPSCFIKEIPNKFLASSTEPF